MHIFIPMPKLASSSNILAVWTHSFLVPPDPNGHDTALLFSLENSGSAFAGQSWERTRHGRAKWHHAPSPARARTARAAASSAPAPVPRLPQGSSSYLTAWELQKQLTQKTKKKSQKWPCLKIICQISPIPCIFNEKKKVFSIVEMSGFWPDKQATKSECWVSWMQTGI